MSTAKHLINVLFLGALCASLGLVCGTNVLTPRVAALEAIANEQLVVVDAIATVLGAAMDANDIYSGLYGRVNVVLDVEGLPLLPVHVDRDSVVGTEYVVYFESADCSDDPIFNGATDPILPKTLVVSDGATVFYSDPSAEAQEMQWVSQVSSSGTCGPTCWPPGCTGSGLGLRGFRASLEPFTPPYSVVTRGELAAP
jgi:hypothetical protein